MAEEITPPLWEHPRDFEDFEYIALWNIFAGIANSISLEGHGGALIIIPKETNLTSAIIRIKYPQKSISLRSSFIDFINRRHAVADLYEQQERGGSISNEEIAVSELMLSESHSELVEATRFVAHLSGCDGATVISDDLILIGFGAEITAEFCQTSSVQEALGTEFGKYKSLNVEEFGMRHRSMLKFISQMPNSSGLVISQDGPISAIWHENEKVVIRKGINLVNLNMPWA